MPFNAPYLLRRLKLGGEEYPARESEERGKVSEGEGAEGVGMEIKPLTNLLPSFL